MARRSARLASKTHENRQTPTLDSVSEHAAERPRGDRPKALTEDESPAKQPSTPTASAIKRSTTGKHSSRAQQQAAATAPPTTPTPSAIKPPKSGVHSSKAQEQQPDAMAAAPTTPAPSAIKPPMSAMHPSKAQYTMAPPSTGLRLGFTDIRPVATRSKELPSGLTQVTPSKGRDLPSTPFTFSVRHSGADPTLSSRAKQMMDELRGEAAKIKAELAAQRVREGSESATSSRKIAMPKGRGSRYSAAHMAAFEKMDSIANHPSAFRAKLTPVAGIKRSSSRADLDELPSSVSRRSAIKRSPSKARLDEPDTTPRPTRRAPVMGSLVKARAAALDTADSNPLTPAKRFKQRMEDDASSNRPVSRDGSSIPRPMSSGKELGRGLTRSKSTISLATSAKASLVRAAAKGPTITAVHSPAKSELPTLKRSVTTANLREAAALTPGRRILSPGRFERVKSILKGTKSSADKAGSALPVPYAPGSRTPAPPRVDKALPSLPTACFMTPRRKTVRMLDATPPTERDRAAMQISPSPLSAALFGPKSMAARVSNAKAGYPSMDSVIAGPPPSTTKRDEGKKVKVQEVVYPDLSVFSGFSPPPSAPSLPLAQGEKSSSMPPATVPGTFTFRSDKTINFNSQSPAAGFGASPGQSSVRHVRSSMQAMPGSFPGGGGGGGNKENTSPGSTGLKLRGISHGMSSKKRHRATTDEEDAEREAVERAAKKRKNEHVPEGDALLAPRLTGKETTTPGTPRPGMRKAGLKLDGPDEKRTMVPRAGVQALSRKSPQKKPVLTMSRLAMLAMPKNR